MNESMMQHGLDWAGEDVTHWLASEKFDGCRAYWDGCDLWTRGGLRVELPDAWRRSLPAGQALDGEVDAGPNRRARSVAAVRWGRFDADLVYRVFDAPEAPGAWPERMARVVERGPVRAVRFAPVEGHDHLGRWLSEIVERQGEGLMLRAPGLIYTPGRTGQLLKLTPYQWRAAREVGHG